MKNQGEKFWEAEQTGVNDVKAFNSKEFINKIKFDGKRYSVSLPWKQKDEECMSAQLPVNYTQSVSRLISLVRRLKETPEHLKKYDEVIRQQLADGIIEKCEGDVPVKGVHYLPHH